MNNKEGVLLVDVHDNSTVNGIEKQVKKFHKGSNDKFKLYFKNILKSRIGEENYSFVDYEIYVVDGKDVLKIWCDPIQSGMGCYLDKKSFMFVAIRALINQKAGSWWNTQTIILITRKTIIKVRE